MDPHSVISLTFTVYSLSGRDLWTLTVLFPSHLLSIPCQEGTYGPPPSQYRPEAYRPVNQISADLRTVGWDEIEFFYEQ